MITHNSIKNNINRDLADTSEVELKGSPWKERAVNFAIETALVAAGSAAAILFGAAAVVFAKEGGEMIPALGAAVISVVGVSGAYLAAKDGLKILTTGKDDEEESHSPR